MPATCSRATCSSSPIWSHGSPGAEPYATFQHPGLKFVYLLSGCIAYRYGNRLVKLGVGDSLLFDASALHGINDIGTQPVSYLSVVFTFRR